MKFKLYDRISVKTILNKKEFLDDGYKLEDYIGEQGEVRDIGSYKNYNYRVKLDNDSLGYFFWDARELEKCD